MYKIYFYVPESHLEIVKDAIFAKGAGKIGNYDCCAWQSKGIGQFRPRDGSHPVLGEVNKLEKVVEYKVETVCENKLLDQVVQALCDSHPYETPAYGYWKINMDGDLNESTQAHHHRNAP